MSEFDYMKALWVQFSADLPIDPDEDRLLQRCKEPLTKEQRKDLLALVDHLSARCDQISLHSFVAGFRLAAGIGKELAGG